jgi:hypothetical protein
MIDAWLNVNELSCDFLGESRTNCVFFIATANKKQPGFGSDFQNLLEGSSQQVDTLQVKQAADISHNDVLFRPAQLGADSARLGTKEPIVESNGDFVGSIAQSFALSCQSVAVGTHCRECEDRLFPIGRCGPGQAEYSGMDWGNLAGKIDIAMDVNNVKILPT